MSSLLAQTLTVASCIVAAGVSAAQVPTKTLSKPDAELAEPFTSVNGVRELRDGRVIVADIREKTVQLADLRSGSLQKIGREGSGPGEFALPARLLALPGDTSAVYDPLNRRFLVIGPDGKPGAFMSFETQTEGGPIRVSLGANYTDARGRLYSQGPSFEAGPNGAPVPTDSAPILRFDRSTRKTDTVAFVHVAAPSVQTSGGAGRSNFSVRVGLGNPFEAVDSWTVMPDGRVAVVRVRDYHVDWYAPNGQRTTGPAVPYERIKVTEADKKQYREQRASGGGTAIVMTQRRGPGGDTRSASVAPPNLNAPEPTDWPDEKPAFLNGAAAAAPNGQLWVLRSRRANDKVPTYDVFDATGRVVSRVALPPETRLVGFGNGTVYLVRSDEDDLLYLQRYRLP